MPRYRVTTPDTQRAPFSSYADFACSQECASPVCVRHLLAQHGFIGCTVHRKRRGPHWEIIFDTSIVPYWHEDAIAAAAYWRRVEDALGTTAGTT